MALKYALNMAGSAGVLPDIWVFYQHAEVDPGPAALPV